MVRESVRRRRNLYFKRESNLWRKEEEMDRSKMSGTFWTENIMEEIF